MTRSDTPGLPTLLGATRRRDEAALGAGFGAHLLGQRDARRGLRGGEPVLKGARIAYLSVQWRGDLDRRPPSGRLRRLEV